MTEKILEIILEVKDPELVVAFLRAYMAFRRRG